MSNELNIVQIQSALLLPVTAQYIKDKLKIEPVRTDKRAMFWGRSQFTDICQGIISQVTAARNADFDKISAQRPKKDAPKADDSADFFGGASSGETDAADFFNDAPATEDFFQ